MRVHPVRRACHQGDAVLAPDDPESRHVGRFDHADAVDLVAQGLAHHLDVEGIALLELVEPGEHQCLDQAPVPGDDRVRALASDGQATAVQVARPELERGFGRAVVDGQVDPDPRDVDRPHDAPASVKHGEVSLVGDGTPRLRERVLGLAENVLSMRGEVAVVRARLLQFVLRPRIRPARDRFLQTIRRGGLFPGGPRLQHDRHGHHHQPRHDERDGHDGQQPSPERRPAACVVGLPDVLQAQDGSPTADDGLRRCRHAHLPPDGSAWFPHCGRQNNAERRRGTSSTRRAIPPRRTKPGFLCRGQQPRHHPLPFDSSFPTRRISEGCPHIVSAVRQERRADGRSHEPSGPLPRAGAVP